MTNTLQSWLRRSAALAFVGDGLKRIFVDRDFLLLGANAPGRAIRLRALRAS